MLTVTEAAAEAITAMKADGTYDKLFEKYFPTLEKPTSLG